MENKKSKRIKINFETINKGLVTPLKIDWEARRKEKEEEIAEDKIRYDNEIKAEEIRFNKLACPCCKSKIKERFVSATTNGVYGPGRTSNITADYLICLGCGVHYSDLNKGPKIKYPKSKEDFLF